MGQVCYLIVSIPDLCRLSYFLFKLSQHGVKRNTLNWIRAFLVDQTKAVVLEGESSSEVPVTSGDRRDMFSTSPLPALYK